MTFVEPTTSQVPAEHFTAVGSFTLLSNPCGRKPRGGSQLQEVHHLPMVTVRSWEKCFCPALSEHFTHTDSPRHPPPPLPRRLLHRPPASASLGGGAEGADNCLSCQGTGSPGSGPTLDRVSSNQGDTSVGVPGRFLLLWTRALDPEPWASPQLTPAPSQAGFCPVGRAGTSQKASEKSPIGSHLPCFQEQSRPCFPNKNPKERLPEPGWTESRNGIRPWTGHVQGHTRGHLSGC